MGLLASYRQVKGVALLAEGVDRNPAAAVDVAVNGRSPSSRRAWIEISSQMAQELGYNEVALLAEGVDRNALQRQGLLRP